MSYTFHAYCNYMQLAIARVVHRSPMHFSTAYRAGTSQAAY